MSGSAGDAVPRYPTAMEVREEYIRTMGAELGQLYYELYNELAWLHVKWRQFRELFGKNPEQIELLNRGAPLFFGFLQMTLFDDVLLHLARLTDPPISMGHENLTLRRLAREIEDQALQDQVESLVQDTLRSCEFARDWRNRRLAHADLLAARHPQLLAPASRQSVEEALAATREVMNCVEQHYNGVKVGYQDTIAPGGADLLVHYLRMGLQAEEHQH